MSRKLCEKCNGAGVFFFHVIDPVTDRRIRHESPCTACNGTGEA